MAQTIFPNKIGRVGGFDETAFNTDAFDTVTIATEVFEPIVGDAFQIIVPDFIGGVTTAGFDSDAFDNTGFDTTDSVGDTVVYGPTVASTGKSSAQQDTGAGSGGSRQDYAPIGGFIRWGKKRKKKPEQVKEVISAVKQVVRQAKKADIAPTILIAPEIDYTDVAAQILANERLVDLRKLEIQAFAQLVERALIELDDEEILLMVA